MNIKLNGKSAHPHRNWKTCILVIVLLAVLLSVSSAFATQLKLDNYIQHPDSSEFYSEQWSISVWAENNFYVHVQFVISNIGIKDGKGAVKVEVTAPNGKRYSMKNKLGKNWKSDKDSFSLNFDGSLFESRGDGMFVSAGNKKISTKLTIIPLTEGFVPKSDKNYYEKDGKIYNIVLLAPRANFEGVLTMAGKKIPIKGVGMVDHSWTTFAPHKLAKHWLKFKFFDGDTTAIYTGFATTDSKGEVNRGFIWLGHGDEILYSAINPLVRYQGRMVDKKSKSKYELPKIVTITSKNGTRQLDVVIKEKKLLKRKDVLADLSAIESFIVARIANPMDYTFNGDFTFELTKPATNPDKTLTKETITANRDYVMQYINP